jgi:hypothetical protein
VTPIGQHSGRDIFDEAMTDRPTVGFGKVAVDAYRVVLIKGQGKVAYDPNNPEHRKLRVNRGIDFKITPLDATKPIISIRTMLDTSPEFQQKVKPSIIRLVPQIAAIKGVDPEDKNFNPFWELPGLFVRYEWVLKPDNPEGKTYRTIAFTDVYPDEARCREAATKELGLKPETNLDQELPFPDDTLNDPKVQQQPQDQKATLAAFLPVFWQQAQQDQKAFAAILAKPPFNGVFTLEDPEVLKVIAGF